MTSSVENFYGHTTADELRLADETPSFSVQAHEARLNSVEAAVTERIRNTEAYLTVQTQEISDELAVVEREIGTVCDGLLAVARSGAEAASTESLAEWSNLDAKVALLGAKVDRLLRQSERTLVRLRDPLASMVDLENRFPAIRRPLDLNS